MNPPGPKNQNPLNSHIISPQDFGRSLISIRDMMAFYQKPIGENERPFTALMHKKNNDLLEVWREKILDKMVNSDGYLETELATISLQVFLAGREVESLGKDYIFSDYSKPPHWLEKFETANFEELWEMGSTCLHYGLTELTKSIKLAIAGEQYDKVFSKSNDPYECYKISRKHRELFTGGWLPYELSKERMKTVLEKVNTAMLIRIDPYQK
jgi:hypothetical protein